MRKNITVRPARAAIAAVLALGSTPLLAQVAAPSAPPPVAATQPAAPVVAAPVATAPAPAPIMKPLAPVVQAIPATPPPAIAETAEAAPARSAPVRTERVRAERPAAPVAQQEVAPAASADPVVAPMPVTEVVAAEETVAPVAPVTDTANGNPADNGALEWGLIGGGIVLLGGAGLLAMTRRRRLREETVPVTATSLHEDRPVAAPAAAEPAFVQYSPAPLAATPAPAFTRQASANGHGANGHHDLEALAAAPPSAENPFLTRKNRLRRAHFLLRQQDAPFSQPMPAAATRAAPQAAQRPAPVYDFGGGMGQGQRRTWRPATT